MKSLLRLTILCLFLCSFFIEAVGNLPSINPEKILFKSGHIETKQNFEELAKLPIPASDIFDGHYYRVIHFNSIPSQEEKKELSEKGLTLLAYIPYNAFFVSIKVGTDLSKIINYNIRTILRIENDQKSSRAIREKNIPDYAAPVVGHVDLIVQYFSDNDPKKIETEFTNRNYRILKSFTANNQFRIRIPKERIDELLSMPAVKYVQENEAPSEPDDTRGRSLHRANMIDSDAGTGFHYDGSGVSISLADDGEVGPHIDFEGRITQMLSSGAGGSHGDMTSGIAVGSGNLDPTKKGMAAGAQIYIFDIDDGTTPYDHIYNAAQYYTTYGSLITSTSYSQGCNDYNTISSTGDQIIHQNPHLNFVFSAGNRGQSDCGYGTNAAWGTITGGFKQGKNVIACGNLDGDGVLDGSSSRGPASDGRVKPDICSNGKDQNSTRDENRYQVGGGTSAACPGITGITAQLVQAYREMHPGTEASSALLKGCLLNSAEDIGNSGPDFTYGWGRVNAARALATLQENRYILDSISNGGVKQHTIQIPANTKQIKCMLYWLDREGDPAAAISLINDLDMTLEDPSSAVFQPWILDPTPVVANITTPAIRGADHLNNMEQVTIDNPASGAYTVEINGTLLPFGAQEYYLIWEFQTEEITLTYPNGGEGFVPGETESLRWDAFGNADMFNIDYSIDNGASWINIVTGFPEYLRQLDWFVPSTVSDQVLVRISRGLFSDESNSQLSIMNLPSGLTVDYVCAGLMQLSWTAAPGATAYEVSRLGAEYMDSLTTVPTTVVQIPMADTVDTWLSVRSIGVNDGKGRRAIAIHKLPGLLTCSFADDLNLATVQSPAAGLLFPCQNLSAVQLSLNINNEGQNLAHGFSLSYSVNGGTPVTEIYADTLLQGASMTFTFTTPVDLSLPGMYQIDFTLTYSADANLTNNNILHLVEVYGASTIPVTEDFQTTVFPPAGWLVTASGVNYEWSEKSGIIGSDGNMTNAAWFDNFSYNNSGARDFLTTFLADLTGVSSPQLSFDVAYAYYAGGSDGLGIEISTDCGTTFIPTSYLKAGSILASAPQTTSDWEPTLPSHWRTDSLSLSAFANSQVMIRFVNINDYGNNLYIDNINIENSFGTGIESHNSPVFMALYPNPSYGVFTLDLTNLASEKLSVKVFDSNSRQVLDADYLNTPGRFSTEINMANFAKGIYMVRVTNGQKVYMLRATVL
ncbi:MAG: S8 family peptidase [Bacteroidia bacterium]|nr:S8 family peptidase [Bacteroidia bacterium]